MKPLKIHFLQTHPIQYHSPLFDRMHLDERIALKVYYCSDYGLSKDGQRYHPEFGKLPNWDVDLVGHHPHQILKNYAFKKGIFKGFFGLMNFGLIRELYRNKPDVLVINGWNYFTLIYAVICSKLLRIKVYVRGDNTPEFEKGISKIKRKIKRIYFGKLLFPMYTAICYVGAKNKSYFKSYGVMDFKLLHLPHAIDNDKFNTYYHENKSQKEILKDTIGISANFVLLYVGRLISIKRVDDILEALIRIKEDLCLIIVGDGPQKNKLAEKVLKNKSLKVKFIGFQNQESLLKYYLIADAFVLSSESETWGLVVNEAMNFNLPIIVSDHVGCSEDLVQSNGHIYPVGDIESLAACIQHLVDKPEESKKQGMRSGEIIKNYSYNAIINNLLKHLESY